MWVDTCTHTHTHTHPHTHTHARAQTLTLITHTHTHACVHTHTHTIPNFTSIHLVISKLEHVGGWTHTHTYTHTHPRAHTCTHTHTTKFYFNPFSLFQNWNMWVDGHTQTISEFFVSLCKEGTPKLINDVH
jgi:hypothetical protein